MDPVERDETLQANPPESAKDPATSDAESCLAGLRPYGLAAGEFRVPGDFDAPLPDDLLDLFEGRGEPDLLTDRA